MARIAWVNLPKGKHVEIALTYIYGVWRTSSQKMLDKLNIERNLKIETISEDDLDRIRAEVKEYIVEWDLRRLINGNIKRLKEIRSYRWLRHQKRLPVRGQSTKTNAKTRKWKSTAVAWKKK